MRVRAVNEKEYRSVMLAPKAKRLKYCISNLVVYGCYVFADEASRMIVVMPFKEYIKGDERPFRFCTYLSFLHDVCVNPAYGGWSVAPLYSGEEEAPIALRDFYLRLLEERSAY